MATGTWERLDTVPYTAVGGDSIELYAYQSSAASGDSFDIDGITLDRRPRKARNPSSRSLKPGARWTG